MEERPVGKIPQLESLPVNTQIMHLPTGAIGRVIVEEPDGKMMIMVDTPGPQFPAGVQWVKPADLMTLRMVWRAALTASGRTIDEVIDTLIPQGAET